MNDLAIAERGCAPWKPSHATQLIAVYDRYDVPTLGVFVQQGTECLFECLLGVAERVQVWAYAALTPDERARLDEAEGDDFEKRIRAVFAHADVVVALASEDDGIVLTAIVERSTRQTPLLEAAVEALSSEADAVSHGMKVAARFRDDARDDALADIR